MAEGIDVIPSDCPANPGHLFPTDQCQAQSPFVLDISSDEDGSGLLVEEPKFTGSDDFDWLAQLLRDESAGASSGGDSDEVVVVKEVNAKSKSKAPRLAVDDEDDDDCVILNSNPDKAAAVAAAAAGALADDSSSDDLLVVGEKGQIACRDYPHSRHLCVKFPFSSTSHEKHCHLCHCYVCDAPAPCIYWGTGVTNTDHCHATDKEELWRVWRKQSKGEKTGLVPSAKLPNVSIPVVSQCTPAPVPLGSTHTVANSISDNFATILNPCSAYASSSFPTGNVATGCNPGLHSHSVSQHLIQVNGGAVHRFRDHKNGCQLTPHSVSSITAFKRFGPVRSSFPLNNCYERTTLQHGRSQLASTVNSVCVQKHPNRRQSELPGVRHIQHTKARPLPHQPVNVLPHRGPSPPLNSKEIYRHSPAYPVIADANHGSSNYLNQSFQPPSPAQALCRSGRQIQTCQPALVSEANSHSAGNCSLTAAEIENWLLEDMPCEDLGSLLGDMPGEDIEGGLDDTILYQVHSFAF
ncbi:uncharacterized protein LOC116188296 isoform X2 [Punica granatum]|uniref:Uncharacterized protein LOC116188296 isoform X2 n=1 Tax=Punica granatum TaxID=22663 RepID=A0A6P8BRK6_PUNGR|nr:uncharacterized protein LOC116188296 isoform X2 [Punica granatum]